MARNQQEQHKTEETNELSNCTTEGSGNIRKVAREREKVKEKRETERERKK